MTGSCTQVTTVRAEGRAMRRIGLLAVSLLATFGVVHLTAAADAKPSTIPFEQAKLIVEVNGTAGDAGLQFSLDSDAPWKSIQISNPAGQKIVDIKAKGNLRDFGLTELFSESNEPPFDEMPISEFEARFPAGEYPFSGETIDGQRLTGTATLTHNIPNGPQIVSPQAGATVAPDAAVVMWQPAPQPSGVNIVGYQVIVEREDPLRVFSVDLPASARSLTVSPEYLEAGTDYNVEVLAIDEGGNQTITESSFATT
jgi:Fibronectin type III domain